MSINYPESCRNTTAGALRQVKQKGSSVSGGVFSKAAVMNMILTGQAAYLSKREPLGKYMSALENTAKEIDAVADSIAVKSRAMVENAAQGVKAMSKISGDLRASADNLASAIEKFGKVANNASFAETAKNAESLVASLERLAELQRSGMLEKVMAAMAGAKA